MLTMHSGVVCWVSYSRTESCVATAKIMRWDRAKAGLGPGVVAVEGPGVDGPAVSVLAVLEPGVAGSCTAGGGGGGGGGGSMTEDAGVGVGTEVGLEVMASGSRGMMGSSAEAVSMVIYLVVGADWRRV